MSALRYCMVLILTVLLKAIHVTIIDASVPAPLCVKPEDHCCPRRPLPRRYDINDLGYLSMFHGWVDVQGQGAANDYCRMVGNEPNIFLSCALAGTNGDSDNNYVSALTDFNRGHPHTWYMRDEDGDGRDDYCRCVGSEEVQQIVCTKAGPKGFFGSANQSGRTNTFTPTGNIDCSNRQGYPSFFRGWADVQGQGAANDFCRMVGIEPTVYLSCALAGTNGDSDYNYQSAIKGFERGSGNTWYMKDEDGDGRDDYCR